MVKNWFLIGLLGILVFVFLELVFGWCWYSYWVWKTIREREKDQSERRKSVAIQKSAEENECDGEEIKGESVHASSLITDTVICEQVMSVGMKQADKEICFPRKGADSAAEISIQSTRQEITNFLSVEEIKEEEDDAGIDEDEEFKI